MTTGSDSSEAVPLRRESRLCIAHRCERHRNVGLLNREAEIRLTVERTNPLAAGGECGACLGEEVDAIYQEYLNVLDVLADALRAHAELRKKYEKPLIVAPR